MDPASIFAIVEGAGGLALKCVSLVKMLNDIASKYKQSRLALLSMVQQLEIVQLAWERIDQWSQMYSQNSTEARCEEDEKLLKRLQTSLDVGHLVMDALEEDLLPFRRRLDNLGLREKTRIVWNESALQSHQDRLGHQVQAMTCLLQTIRLGRPESRRELLRLSEPILLKSDESAYSIVPSRMSSKTSLSTTASTEGTSLQYRCLAFENTLFTARVYKRNYRNTVIEQLFRTRTDRGRNQASLETKSTNVSGSETALSRRHSPESMISYCSTRVDLLFLDACQSGAVETLRKLVQPNLKIDSHKVSFDIFRWSLFEAVMNGRLDIAQILLKANPESHVRRLTWDDGHYLLERACTECRVEFLKLVLSSDLLTPSDLTLQLLKAASNNMYEVMMALIEGGADVGCFDRNEYGCRPLHLASLTPKGPCCIALLLDHGAEIDAQDLRGMTPLIWACWQGNLRKALYLIACGANPNIRDGSGEKAADKLRELKVGFEVDCNLIRDLRLKLARVSDAEINTSDPQIHVSMQQAALRDDVETIEATLWGAGKAFFTSLLLFVRLSSKELCFPSDITSIITKASYRETAVDLVSKAEKIFEVNVILLENFAEDHSLRGVLFNISNFLFSAIYRFTTSPYQQQQLDQLKALWEPVQEALNVPMPTIHSTSSREDLNQLIYWSSVVEYALPRSPDSERDPIRWQMAQNRAAGSSSRVIFL